jgi:teichoic acid transport system permease protein
MSSLAADPQSSALIELGRREPLRSYVGQIWKRRDFAVELARSDLRAKHLDSALGQIWHLLNPTLMVIVYYVVFGVLLDARDGVDNYISFLVIGVLFFRQSQRAITDSASAISKNAGLIRSIQFPRAILPISVTLEQFIAFGPALLVIAVTMAFDGVALSARMLMVIPVIALQQAFNLGAGFVVARLGSRYSDLREILPHFFRIMLYLSGVLFSVQDRVDNETVRALFAILPFYDIITAARWALMGTDVTPGVWLGLVVWSLGLLIIGFAYFRRGEARYGS